MTMFPGIACGGGGRAALYTVDSKSSLFPVSPGLHRAVPHPVYIHGQELGGGECSVRGS